MSVLAVTVLNRQRARRVAPRALAGFLRRVARAVPAGRADRLGVCLVSDQKMIEYNLRYRGKNASTDVLAFPASRRATPEEGVHLGDIVVSVSRAAAQARAAGHSLEREMRVLLLHGYLHLLGYDHETDDGTMRRLERKLVRRLVPAGRRRRS